MKKKNICSSHHYIENGIEKWYDYNEDHRLIRYMDSEGNISERDYNEKGDLIYIKNSNGYEGFYDYETPLEVIKLKDNKGIQNTFIYDNKYTKVIKELNGCKVVNIYDKKNRRVFHSDPFIKYNKIYNSDEEEFKITYI